MTSAEIGKASRVHSPSSVLSVAQDLLYAPHVFNLLLETLAQPTVTRPGTELVLTFPTRFTEVCGWRLRTHLA